MENETGANSPSPTPPRVFVWDVPVRLFHWTLLALMIALVVTAEVLDDTMELHAKLGLATLTLVLFRVAWGMAGSSYARFSQFVRGPGTVVGYARSLLTREHRFIAGHNPLGGWMVVVLLLTILMQAVLGLFANDDVLFEGPLAHLVSKETSDLLTGLHEDVFHALLVLVGLHVAAVIWHKVAKGENLVPPMFTGYKPLPPGAQADHASGGGVLRAVILLLLSAGVVYWLAG